MRWCVLGADDCGAPHRRKRVWMRLVRNAEHDGLSTSKVRKSATARNDGIQARPKQASESAGSGKQCEKLADTSSILKPIGIDSSGAEGSSKTSPKGAKQSVSGGCIEEIPDTDSSGPSGSWWAKEPCYTTQEEYREINRAFDGSRWGIESPICRVAAKCPNSMDRLKALGNMQVSIVAATAWRLLE